MAFHELLMPQRIVYGQGSFAEVGQEARRLGQKALLISDPVMEKVGNVAACEEHLQAQGLVCVTYAKVDSEPTDIHLAEALALCRDERCDVIVAVGGGSCLDTAKAVALLMTNEGQIAEYVAKAKTVVNKPLPLIAVPTTAGTGSEVTKMTVITDTARKVKMMLADPALLPHAAIVDPLLSVSCPPNVTAATGIDALCHAIEAYLSRRAQPATDIWARTAIELIATHLRRAYEDGADFEARDKMAFASMLAGAAFSNASVALVHGMSRPIGAVFHVPHGISNAMLLPAVLAYTKEAAVGRLAEIGRLMQPEIKALSDEQAAEATIEEIKSLCLDLHIPSLRHWGIDQQAFQKAAPKMAVDALASGSPGNNPKIPTVEEIVRLYHIAYDYDFRGKLQNA
ncbi:iron-containing alcohol dehydrogenase [Brevibacillus agri]